jgi:hypothetical protein
MAHTPVAHVAVAFGCVQATLHPAQLVFVSSGVSQPSEARPLQLPKPGSHVAMAHAPFVHADVALDRAHGVHEAPQVFTLVLLAHAPEQMW